MNLIAVVWMSRMTRSEPIARTSSFVSCVCAAKAVSPLHFPRVDNSLTPLGPTIEALALSPREPLTHLLERDHAP
jgi:hypothetical protein